MAAVVAEREALVLREQAEVVVEESAIKTAEIQGLVMALLILAAAAVGLGSTKFPALVVLVWLSLGMRCYEVP
jgi:hypothetical protein